MADIGKFDDRPTHGEGVTFTHKRPDLPGEATRTFKGRIEGGQQVWDIQAPESTSGGSGVSGLVIAARFILRSIKEINHAGEYNTNATYDLESEANLIAESTLNKSLFAASELDVYGNLTDRIPLNGGGLDYVWQEDDITTYKLLGDTAAADSPETEREKRMYTVSKPRESIAPSWANYNGSMTKIENRRIGVGCFEGTGVIKFAETDNSWYTASAGWATLIPDSFYEVTVYRQGGGSGGSSTGAGEFLGRVDFNSGGSVNNWSHTHTNNPGHSLPDPADLIMPTAHNKFPYPDQSNPLEFKNLTNNTYVIENVGYDKVVTMNGPGETGYIDAVILPPNTRVGVYDGYYEGMWSSNYSNTAVPPHSWYIYKGGGKEHSIDFIKAFYSDLRAGNYGWSESNYNEVSSLPLVAPDGIYIEGVAI